MQQPPYHTKDRELFLVNDVVLLMSDWLIEALKRSGVSASVSGRPSSPYRGGTLVGRFPADVIDQTISAYIELLPFSDDPYDMRTRLRDMQKKVRERF